MSAARVQAALKALNGFFSQFLPAYAEGCAPDGAALPYITYPLVVPDILGEATCTARVWYRADGYAAAAEVLDAIGAAIGPGRCLPAECGGALWIYRGSCFVQFMFTGDARLKCACVNVKIAAVM